MRRINFRIFFVLSLLLVVFAFFAYSEISSADDQHMADNFLLRFSSEAFNVLRFPTHVLFPALTKFPFYFSIGLLINCLFFALLIERLLYFIFFRQSDEDDYGQDTPVDI